VNRTIVDEPRAADHSSPGVDAWRNRLRAAPRWTPGDAPMVVVVPHPDDETLGVGGLICQQRRAGVDVSVVAVTDGDAAYAPNGDPVLAAQRTQEQNAALDQLGVAAAARRRLALPDSRVDRFEDDLVAALMDVLGEIGSAVTLVAPSHLDVHPDHEAVGRAARRAAAARSIELVTYFFWTWHHRAPHEIDGELVGYELTAETLGRKFAALASHRSQIDDWEGHAPILDAGLLEPTLWANEYFLVSRP